MDNEDRRRYEELNSTRDCVEEILFVVTNTYLRAMYRNPRESSGEELYSAIEAILIRAQDLATAPYSRRRNAGRHFRPALRRPPR